MIVAKNNSKKKNNLPVTSYGIINVRLNIDDDNRKKIKKKFNTENKTVYKIISSKCPGVDCYIRDKYFIIDSSDVKINISNMNYIQTDKLDISFYHKFHYYLDKISIMMVSRKYSLGYVEFLKGKYNVYDPNSVKFIFEQMYQEEIFSLANSSYDDILYNFVNRKNETKKTVLNRIYENFISAEYPQAKTKFNMLRDNKPEHNLPHSLDYYIKTVQPKYFGKEWGFPKGRKYKYYEKNISCAVREFEEETGYEKNDYVMLNKIIPLEENLRGTNNFHYRHIYYISLDNKNNEDSVKYDDHEIGEIKWFSYDQAISNIRCYHTEKKAILTKIYLFMLLQLIKLSQ
jgi:8-oxo-dGTP pyrophosphatase MutT (NUDIX family)